MLFDKDNRCAGLRNTNNNEINLEEGSGNSNLMDCGLNIYVLFGYYCFKLNIYIFYKKNSFIEWCIWILPSSNWNPFQIWSTM